MPTLESNHLHNTTTINITNITSKAHHKASVSYASSLHCQ